MMVYITNKLINQNSLVFILVSLTILGKVAKLNSVYVFILFGILDRTNTTTLPYAQPLCYAHLSWTAKSIATIGFIGNYLFETSLH